MHARVEDVPAMSHISLPLSCADGRLAYPGKEKSFHVAVTASSRSYPPLIRSVDIDSKSCEDAQEPSTTSLNELLVTSTSFQRYGGNEIKSIDKPNGHQKPSDTGPPKSTENKFRHDKGIQQLYSTARAKSRVMSSENQIPDVASEVNFDLLNPPLYPDIQPSTRPIGRYPMDLGKNDVLLGRGGFVNSLVGNVRYRVLMDQLYPTYKKGDRQKRPLIARSIVLIVRSRGGRFVKKETDDADEGEILLDIGDDKAVRKTMQALVDSMLHSSELHLKLRHKQSMMTHTYGNPHRCTHQRKPLAPQEYPIKFNLIPSDRPIPGYQFVHSSEERNNYVSDSFSRRLIDERNSINHGRSSLQDDSTALSRYLATQHYQHDERSYGPYTESFMRRPLHERDVPHPTSNLYQAAFDHVLPAPSRPYVTQQYAGVSKRQIYEHIDGFSSDSFIRHPFYDRNVQPLRIQAAVEHAPPAVIASNPYQHFMDDPNRTSIDRLALRYDYNDRDVSRDVFVPHERYSNGNVGGTFQTLFHRSD